MIRSKRLRILERCRGKCFYCGKPFTTWVEFNIDHVLPKSKGGSDDIKNKVLSCMTCNTLKAAYTLNQFEMMVMSRLQIAKREVIYYQKIINTLAQI